MSGPQVTLHERFVVDTPPAAVRAAFEDVPAVIDCIPGASITATNPDGTFSGRIGVQYGETSVHLAGAIRRTLGEPLRVGVHAEGQDGLGSVRASGDITVELASSGESATEVTITAEFSFAGVLAPLARSATKIMGPQLMTSFGRCLGERAADARGR